jgi:hypothetical protein
VWLALILMPGCGSDASKSAGESKDDSIEQTARQDGVQLSFRVSPKAPVMGTPVTVTVTARTESGVSADIGDYAARLAEHPFEYKVASSRAAPPRRDENGHVTGTWEYQLDFFLPGQYELPAPTVMWPSAAAVAGTSEPGTEDAGSTHPSSLATEPIRLTVRSGDAGELGDEQLAQIPVADPVSLPREPFDWRKHWWIPTLGVTILALTAMLIRRWWKRRGALPVVPPVPAHEWARAQIAALLADKLVERGLHQDFFYRLSGIVRGYVERRFGMSAPEMTTEEFLSAMSGDERFRNEHRDLLRHFLRECDMVKYACHQPDASEYDRATHSAGDFVEETRAPAAEPNGASVGAGGGGS